jgi:hypothetical protein
VNAQALDADQIGDKITAYLLVGTQVGKENETADRLRAVANVTGAYLVFGEYDILVEMACVNLSVLDASIAATKKLDHVTRVMPLIAAKQC